MPFFWVDLFLNARVENLKKIWLVFWSGFLEVLGVLGFFVFVGFLVFSPVKMFSSPPSVSSQSLLPGSARVSNLIKVTEPGWLLGQQQNSPKVEKSKHDYNSNKTWRTSWTTQVSPLLQTTVSWLKEALKIKARFQPSLIKDKRCWGSALITQNVPRCPHLDAFVTIFWKNTGCFFNWYPT